MFFKKGSIDSSYKKVRFHIIMLFRIINSIDQLPPFNSKKMDKYCEHLLEVLYDDSKSIKAFKKCIEIIDNSGFDKSDKTNLKSVSKTKILIDFA
jgi:hypothetical protein